MGRLVDALSRAVAGEQDRLALWLPVLFGCGIAIYFALPVEPPVVPLLIAAGLSLLSRLYLLDQRIPNVTLSLPSIRLGADHGGQISCSSE